MYSQRNEEKYILEACKDSTRKRVLDIGAWDPRVFSNSRALIEQGWGGVLVEFSPTPLKALAVEYKTRADIEVLAAAVVMPDEPEVISMQITDDAVSAPAGSDAVKKWAKAGNFIGRLSVPTLTIAQLIDLYGAFDFVNIDTEGTSVDLLKVLLATEMFPRCICVEHDGRILEALQAARKRRAYHSVYESEENLVFSL